MPSEVFRIEEGRFGLTLTAPTPAPADVCAALESAYDSFGCQITDGALNASSNVTNDPVPATWCQPEQANPIVGATSYTLDLTYLQDPHIVEGLSRFLFEHDTETAYFYVGLAGDDPPKATGVVRLVAGAFGGPGRTALTATVSLPVVGKPEICYGDAVLSEAVGGDVVALADAAPAAATTTTTKAKASTAS